MEMRQLKIFCAVSDLGSFTAAAEQVNTVQSNVTMRIKELEAELGHELFIRKKTGVTLTPAGETFLSYAQRILRLTDESRTALVDSGTPAGPLRLGSMETTAAIRLPQVLTRYRELHPTVKLSLMTGTTTELIKAIETHKIDGAFVGGFHQNTKLIQDEVFNEELVLVSSTQFDNLETLMAEVPSQTVLVFRTGCFYRSTLENWFYQAGLIPNQIMELGTLDGILTCVSAGLGVTLLPKSVAQNSSVRHAVRCHSLPPEFANVSTVFIRLAESLQSSAMKAFLDIALELGSRAFCTEHPQTSGR
ncbi:LysR family transcriptional regulator [Pseudomonas sp. TE21394]